MDHSKTPKTSSDSNFANESSASSSSSGYNLRLEKMVEVVKKEEQVSSCRRIQKSDREKIRRDKLNEQFLKLGDALDPIRPRGDKVSVLTETIQMLKDLVAHVDRLKAEHAALSQESRKLIQEKSELREEKLTLKSDIEILNAQYQEKVRTMVPWIPHYSYTIPVVAITQAPNSVPPQLQSFPFYGTQSPYSDASNNQESKSKCLDLNLMRNSTHKDHKDDLGLELELKIHASSSAQEDVSEKEKKGASTTTSISSNGVVKS